MNEKELIAERAKYQMMIADWSAVIDGSKVKLDPKNYSRIKRNIVIADIKMKELSEAIREIRNEQKKACDDKYTRNFVSIAKSILEQDLFQEISNLAHGVSDDS